MSERIDPFSRSTRPSRIAVIFVYLAFLAVVARTLSVDELRPVLASYLWLELAYLILYTLVLWKPKLPTWLLHLYFIVQCALILWMITLWPEFDFVVLLFLLLVYQVSLYSEWQGRQHRRLLGSRLQKAGGTGRNPLSDDRYHHRQPLRHPLADK